MNRRGAQAYRGQWTRCAIVLNIKIDADSHVLASLALGSAINGLVLSRGQGTEPDNEYRQCRSQHFHTTLQFVADRVTGIPMLQSMRLAHQFGEPISALKADWPPAP